jgi:oligopeptide/dipeptide ABC transporter ATP-binding protein
MAPPSRAADCVAFATPTGPVTVVQDLSFSLESGETLCIAGESGSGKSVTALALMGLLPKPGGRITSGTALFQGRDLFKLPEPEMRKIRGNEIAMIFQEPMTSLNPVHAVGSQIAEAVMLHRGANKTDAYQRTVEMLRQVGIGNAEQRFHAFPHRLSGGLRQRCMIPMALSCYPRLLIADEPTTALDVTIQAQILELLRSLQTELGMSILLITHDLAVVAETCDEVCVMYAGRIVERAAASVLFASPRHHYTAGLLRSVPNDQAVADHGRLVEIPGMVPSLTELPKGCKFVDRCPAAEDLCRQEAPALVPLGKSLVRCHYPLDAP